MRDTLDVMLKGMMNEALAEGGIIGAGLARMATGVREAIEAEMPGRR